MNLFCLLLIVVMWNIFPLTFQYVKELRHLHAIGQAKRNRTFSMFQKPVQIKKGKDKKCRPFVSPAFSFAVTLKGVGSKCHND